MNREVDFYIMDSSFRKAAVIDNYTSLIWADRYNECGDFELHIPYSAVPPVAMNYISHGNFASIQLSDHLMVIEKIEDNTDDDGATEMVISGRSLESILDRRLHLVKVELTDANVQDAVYSFLYANFISPSNSNRRVNNFTFRASSDPAITQLTFTDSYEMDDVLDIISGICKDKRIGFKLVLEGSTLVFSLYSGKSTPTVTFSPFYDNLKNSNYYSSSEKYKNVMYITTDDDGWIAVAKGEGQSGINRREVQEDISEFKKNKKGTISQDQLAEKARKKLTESYGVETAFDAEIIPDVMYSYRTDYNTGDHVWLVNTHGKKKELYISEVVITRDENGLTILPAFQEIEEEDV